MKIISGEYKGRNLSFTLSKKSFQKDKNNQDSNLSDELRPTQAKVRDAVFNTLSFELEGKVLIDLFSGTGSIGIEGLSRGIKKVYFVDNSPNSILLLKRNLSFVSEDKYSIFEYGFKRFLNKIDFEFDYIYIDPPYSFDYKEILDEISKLNFKFPFKLIVERKKDVNIDYKKYDGFILEKTKKYGSKVIDYINKG